MKEKKKKTEEERIQQKDVPAEAVETDAGVDAADEKQEDRTQELEAQVKELEAQLAELKDQFLRAHADLDNTRKRLAKDKEEAIKFANSKLIEELLGPMDNLQRAVDSCASTNDVKAIAEGVGMVAQQLSDVLSHNGLEPIVSAPGTEFNPEEHEACMMEMSPDVTAETVAQEFIKGYRLHGRVLRPAKVKVSKPEI